MTAKNPETPYASLVSLSGAVAEQLATEAIDLVQTGKRATAGAVKQIDSQATGLRVTITLQIGPVN